MIFRSLVYRPLFMLIRMRFVFFWGNSDALAWMVPLGLRRRCCKRRSNGHCKQICPRDCWVNLEWGSHGTREGHYWGSWSHKGLIPKNLLIWKNLLYQNWYQPIFWHDINKCFDIKTVFDIKAFYQKNIVAMKSWDHFISKNLSKKCLISRFFWYQNIF